MIRLCCFFFAYIIVANSGTVSYLRGVPRLGNISYWDYYFICTSIGQTQQWSVNNFALGEFSLGIAQVLSGTNSEFSHITSLLSLKQTPSGDFEHISVLIVTCEASCYLEVLCSNGSLSMPANNAENKTSLYDRENGSHVFLDYVLTKYIFETGTPKYISIFVCGVENMFLTWQVDAFETLAFTTSDLFGQSRRTLQENDTTVKQQGISFGNKPYTLVTVLIVIHSEVLNVMCGYPQNEVSLTTIELLPTMQSTLPSNPSDHRTTTTTTENVSGVNVAAAATLPVIFVIIIVAIIILTTFIFFWLYKKKQVRSDPDGPPSGDNIPKKKICIKKTPKSRQKNVNYKTFRERIHYLLFIVSSNVFEAAMDAMKAPDIEDDSFNITKLDDNLYIGMFRDTPVGLIKHDENSNGQAYIKTVRDAIIDWFPNVMYLLSVGHCLAFESKEVSLGDVLVSRKIIEYTVEKIEEAQKGEERISINQTKTTMGNEICAIFCVNVVQGLNIAKSDREAKHFVGNIISDPNGRHNDHFNVENETLGVERDTGYLLDLQKNGILMKNGENRIIQVIAIKAVVGFVNKKVRRGWKFQAGKAAIHYIAKNLEAL